MRPHRLSACMRRKCKLYRFDNDSGEWKERGVGQVRLLQSQDHGKIRLLMRQEKTLKIRANHFGTATRDSFFLLLTIPWYQELRLCGLHVQFWHMMQCNLMSVRTVHAWKSFSFTCPALLCMKRRPCAHLARIPLSSRAANSCSYGKLLMLSRGLCVPRLV